MNRRDALKNVGIIAGGLIILPYACGLTPEIKIVFSFEIYL